MRITRTRATLAATALGAVLLFAAAPLEAQRPPVRKPSAKVESKAMPGTACCEITAIEARARLVTAKDAKTGKSFQFRVTDTMLLRSLTVGQKVYRAEGAQRVGIAPGLLCCSIGAPAAAAKSQASSAVAAPVRRAPVSTVPIPSSVVRVEETAPAKEYPADTQDHPGKTARTKKVTLHGDTEALKSIAGHAAIYARYRYGIEDVTTEADYERARGEMYDFLSWKYGNPSLVATQFVSAGYQHFDHHADEAAAALLGMELPGPGAQVKLPKELSDWLKAQVDSLASNGGEGSICAQLGDSTYVGIACELLLPFVQQAIEQSIDRIGISSAALIGKNKYDVTDAEIELLIHVRRNPTIYDPDPTRQRSKIGGKSP